MRGAPVPTARFQFAAEKLGDAVWFLFDFSFGEVEHSIASCFKGEVSGAFVGVSVGPSWAIDLNGKALLLPKEVHHHSSDAFSGHASLRL